MKQTEIKRYIIKSADDSPTYILLMRDNKEYISNGCTFVESTKENIEHLISKHDCKKEKGVAISSRLI